MKWVKKKDLEMGKNVNDVMIFVYNKFVIICDILLEVDEYMFGLWFVLVWIIDWYWVKKDKVLGIVNDFNDWVDEVGNLWYIVDFIVKVMCVVVEMVWIVEGIREVGEEK